MIIYFMLIVTKKVQERDEAGRHQNENQEKNSSKTGVIIGISSIILIGISFLGLFFYKKSHKNKINKK